MVRNSDELFERDEFSAAPDVGWPDCFNSGVFVFRPSVETFNNLVQFAVEKGSFDGRIGFGWRCDFFYCFGFFQVAIKGF